MLYLAAISILTRIKNAGSFSTGAGSCVSGQSSVGGSHLSTNKTIYNSTLTGSSILVRFTNIVVRENRIARLFVGTYYNLVVQTVAMKGVLIRAQSPNNTTINLIPNRHTKLATNCASPAIGVTHVNSTIKNTASAFVRHDTPTNGVMFDINVVYMNGDIVSDFAYGRVYADFRCKNRGEICSRGSQCCAGTVCRRRGGRRRCVYRP
jgi:hypothetical protein